MTENFYALLIGIALTVFHITLVTQSIRMFDKFPPVFIHFFSGILSLVLLLILTCLTPVLNTWLVFCVLSFGISSYLFVFGAIYKSLSLRMLLFTNSQGGKITLHALNENITEKSFQTRVDLLIKMGYCTEGVYGYHLSAKGKKIIRKIIFVRQLFRINSLGLY
jgi:hypothetical protein